MAHSSVGQGDSARTGAAAADPPGVLVIHPGALGDVLQAVPALRALRLDGPLVFSGQPRLGGLLCGLGLVDAVLPFDGLGLEALFSREAAPASLVSRLQAFRRVISWFGARDELYPLRLRAIVKDCVIAPPVPGDDNRTTVWRHLLLTIGAGSRVEVAPVELPRTWREEAGRVLVELGAAPTRPLLVTHPGAGSRWKVWPADNLARVIERAVRDSDGQALIHQGPADREVVDGLVRILDARALRLIEPELPLLAAILGHASAFLGGDSGVSHLAAAVGAPAVILFPAETRERWTPWSPTAQALTMTDEAGQVEQVAAALTQLMRG
jgi:heptosyltransferase-3